MIRGLFERLASEPNHGPIMVSRSLAYLAAAKNGLSEDELLDVLSRDKDAFSDFKSRAKHTPPEERLPVIVWSRLYFDLEPYLSERSADGASLLSFYHRQLRKVAEEEYLKGDDKPKRHSSLASYFANQALFDPEKKTPNVRKLSELPYQQTHGALWDDLYKTLTDFEFLEAKCTYVAVATSGKGQDVRKIHGGVYALQEDYQRALENWQGEPGTAGVRTRTRYPIIVTAVDFGNGPVVRCPVCVQLLPLQEDWLGQEITCPREGCNGWMKVNPFIAGRSVG